MLMHFRNSIIEAITNIYPEHPWNIWKFSQVPVKYWSKTKNVLQVTMLYSLFSFYFTSNSYEAYIFLFRYWNGQKLNLELTNLKIGIK